MSSSFSHLNLNSIVLELQIVYHFTLFGVNFGKKYRKSKYYIIFLQIQPGETWTSVEVKGSTIKQQKKDRTNKSQEQKR